MDYPALITNFKTTLHFKLKRYYSPLPERLIALSIAIGRLADKIALYLPAVLDNGE